MPLPGISKDHGDFPSSVRDSQSILPFSLGGTTTLSTTDTPEDLVLVSQLRRFENKTIVARGTETTGGNSTTTITDSTADFINWGVEVGDVVTNTTDSNATWDVDAVVSATVLTVSLNTTGGGDDDWDASDAYTITKSVDNWLGARATSIRSVRIRTDLECWIEIDGEAGTANHLVHLLPGGVWNEDGKRIVSRISFVNSSGTDTPTLSWTVYGL